jgi:hypothetical protein
MREDDEQVHLPRLTCPYCHAVLERDAVDKATVTKTAAWFKCLNDCGTFTDFTVAETVDGPKHKEW